MAQVVYGVRRYSRVLALSTGMHYAGKQKHFFHIVTESPGPIFGAVAALCLTVGLVQEFHGFVCYGYGMKLIWFSLFFVCFVASMWGRDVIREATFLGYHTRIVVRGLRIGMILFIISEAMFFFSFFGAFFHASLSPSVVLGCVWPPIGINMINPLRLPLLNTVILLSSGVAVTVSHFCICSMPVWHCDVRYTFYHRSGPLIWQSRLPDEFDDDRPRIGAQEVMLINAAQLSLSVAIGLAIEFTACQAYEYYHALFYINDGVFGSTFYVATGFHGLHVIIGSVFLTICLYRMLAEHFTRSHHLGLEMAIGYWHFVDVVWLVLYVFIYCWSGGLSSMTFG